MGKTIRRSVESDRLIDGVLAGNIGVSESIETGLYLVEAWRGLRRREVPKSGAKLLFRDIAENALVDQGLNHKRSVIFLSGTPITAWFVMPTDGTPTIANADTYASHAGWAEVINYDETTREAWTGVATGTVGEVSNAASRCEYTISAGGATIGGCAFVGGGSSPGVKNNTAGGGTLMSAAAFSAGDRVLQEADVLRVTYIQRTARPS